MNIKTYLTVLTIVAAVSLSCCGQKQVSDENLKTTAVENTKFDSTGYIAGTIVQNKEAGDCEWIIKLKDGNFIETMNMDKNFMSDNNKVWIKYTPQRRMQRCKNAAPVAITEMVKRQ